MTELIPTFRRRPKAYIFNVGSVAAYQAVPTLAVYAATKTYVRFFSRALRHELRKEGIVVSSLNPGPVDTGFPDRAGMQTLRHLTDKYNTDVHVVAEAAVKGLFRGKPEIIPGALHKFTAFANRLLPRAWTERIAAGLFNVKNTTHEP